MNLYVPIKDPSNIRCTEGLYNKRPCRNRVAGGGPRQKSRMEAANNARRLLVAVRRRNVRMVSRTRLAVYSFRQLALVLISENQLN